MHLSERVCGLDERTDQPRARERQGVSAARSDAVSPGGHEPDDRPVTSSHSYAEWRLLTLRLHSRYHASRIKPSSGPNRRSAR